MTVAIQDPVQYALWVELGLCDLRKDARFHPDDEVEGVAKSIAVKQLQSIAVCRIPDPANPGGWRYEVIFGVGRVLAGRKLNWEKIRADVYEELSEFQKLQMIFAENEDRKNASPLYQAQLLNEMMKADNITQDQLAETMNKSQQTISDYLGLLKLSPKVWANTSTLVKFGMRHFKQLLRIENEDDQWKLAEIAREKGLSSSELATLIDKQLGVKSGKKAGRPKGDKNVGTDGFAFVQNGSNLRIKANCDLSGDLDAFLAQLKAAIMTWRESHPQKTPAKAESALVA
jgi:ParB family transcriptional regulator, chromosome partitioning protein